MYDAQAWLDQRGMDAQRVGFNGFQSFTTASISTDQRNKPVCHLFFKKGSK